jgi:hypothetical protein
VDNQLMNRPPQRIFAKEDGLICRLQPIAQMGNTFG